MKRIIIFLSAIGSLIININCSSSKKLDPVTEAYRKSAFSKYKLHDYNGAITICKEAIAKNPQNDVAYSIIGGSYWGLEDYDNAYISFNQALIIKPNDKELRFYRAFMELKLKKYKEAIVDFDCAIKKEKGDAHIYHLRGWIKGNIYKQYQAELNDYDSCLMLDEENHLFVHQKKANVYLYLNQFESAAKELNKYIKKDPQQLSLILHHFIISKKFYELKKDSLLKDSTFRDIYQGDADGYTRLAYLNMILGKHKLAEKYLELSKVLPMSTYGHYSLKSELAWLQYDFKKALAYDDTVIGMFPKNAYCYTLRGNILRTQGDYLNSMSAYNKAINLDSSQNDGFFYRGVLKLAMENYPDAINDFTSSINVKIDSIDYSGYNARGYAYFMNKQYKEALTDYDMAIKQAQSTYQPFWEYRKEALDALSGIGTNALTTIYWQLPIDDANYLRDSARFHISYEEPLKINLKIITNHLITKDSIVTSINGIPFIGDVKLTLKKNAATTNQQVYEIEETLKLPLGEHSLQIKCDNKHSQIINVVVE